MFNRLLKLTKIYEIEKYNNETKRYNCIYSQTKNTSFINSAFGGDTIIFHFREIIL